METTNRKKVDLGFTNQQFEPGVHVCQIFNDDDERHDALMKFIVNGISNGENTACFTENETEQGISTAFNKSGLNYGELIEKGCFALNKTSSAYFEGGKFVPENMLQKLRVFYDESIKKKYSGARVIGEMVPEVEKVPGGERLLEYESRVSMLLRECPINAVCQYDARQFDGATILNILKVHPYMIIRGAVVHNPFYIQPEEFLANSKNGG